MLAAFRLHPLLAPFIFFASGIAAAGSCGVLLPAYLLPLLLLLSICCRFLPTTLLFNCSTLLLLFVCGNLLLAPLLPKNQAERRILDEYIGQELLVEGVIIKRPEARDDGSRLLLEIEQLRQEDSPAESIAAKGFLQLHIGSGGRTELMTGDRIRFAGKLRPPRNYGISGEFDAERYYALKRIVATTFVKSAAEIVPLGQTGRLALQRHFDLTAATIGKFIMAALPTPENGIIKALLIGDTADIPQPLKDAYSRTGVNHILSISGFHVGIIALALLQLWQAVARLFPAMLLYLNFHRIAFAVSLPLIIYYLFLSGAAPATVRSVLMLALVTIGLFLERESSPINLIILAAFALLLLNPANLYDISFQLSFLALWGITVLTPLLLPPVTRPLPAWLGKLLLFAAASAAAVAVTLLPVAYYFQQTSLTGIVSNFLVVPLLGYGAVVCGFAATPFIWLFPRAADLILQLAGLVTALANRTIAFMDRIPPLPAFAPAEAEIIILLLALLLVTISRSRRTKYLLLATTVLGIVLSHQIPAAAHNFSLKMDFISVGQGEATLLTFHDGTTMLIDGGGALHDNGRDIGKQLLLPALRKQGVKRIDRLVLSHSHPDHLQGLIAVATAMPVGEFWENGRNCGKDYRTLRLLLDARKVPVRVLDTNSAPQLIAGVTISTLHPAATRSRLFADQNEDSLVLRFETGQHSALFTGDIGVASQFELLDRKAPLGATLLKVPHHGSRNSALSVFFTAVSPQLAMISAGYKNSFGLPAAETLTLLQKVGAEILRTDQDGTVTVTFPLNGAAPLVSAIKRQIH